MKKFALILSILGVFCSSNTLYAASSFEALEGISPAQLQKLTRIQQNYKLENNALDTKIMGYNNKLIQVQNDKDKSADELAVLESAYARNIATLKSQQKALEEKTDEEYKAVLTQEQYDQYKAQQANVQEAFHNFLQK
jgi:hypothetical protein